MSRRQSFLCTLLVMFALLVAGSPLAPVYGQSTMTSQAPPHSLTQRWIVRLEEPSLAQSAYTSSYTVMTQEAQSRGKLRIDSPAAQEYRALLAQRQEMVFQAIRQVFAAAQLEQTYQIVFNGMSVTLPTDNEALVAQIRTLPGVAEVYPEQGRELAMFSSLPLLNTEALWNNPAIGGQANAGEGIKIAVIDSGIKIDNPFFDPSGYAYPSGYPKGEVAHTTPKVIAARAYFRPDLTPMPGSETPQPGPEDSSHGTHVAGTAAGNANTQADLLDLQFTISGVAPRAYLMNYKTFYASDSVFSGLAFETELIAAVEDAVADGADVINCSWGGRDSVDPHFDPIAVALNGAAEAGISVVISVGNGGPSKSTADGRDFTDKLIMVGASTTSQTIAAGFVDVTAPVGVPEDLAKLPYSSADFGEPIEDTMFGPAPYVPVGTLGGSSLACDPLPEGALNGAIALMERGTCHFSIKVFHAQQAGAIAAIVYNDEDGGESIITMSGGDNAEEVTIPAIFVQHSTGMGMLDWYAQHGNAAQAQIDPGLRTMDITPDMVGSFSSRGPTFKHSLKPDVVAPGVNILSAGFDPTSEGIEEHLHFGMSTGSSMAAPHVSGAAALLKQVHPNWSPLEIKSALMSTANTNVWLDNEGTEPAGVLARGAGRIDLAKAVNPGLVFDPPAVSFGLVSRVAGQPMESSMTITARNISTTPLNYSLHGQQTGIRDCSIAVSPAELMLGPGETGMFTVKIVLPPDAEAGDYEGLVHVQGGLHDLHLPLWVRALPTEQSTKVLLIDNDASSTLDLPNYSHYYTSTLQELGIPFTYLDVDAQAPQEQTLPDISALQRYEMIIWFTGDNFVPSGTLSVPLPLTEKDQNVLIAYMQSGGSLIAMGQDLTEASDIESSPPGPHYGRSDLYHYYLGARFVRDDVFESHNAGTHLVVGMSGKSWLESIKLDLSPLPEGMEAGLVHSAGNLESVDEVKVIDEDPRTPDLYTNTIFRVLNPINGDDGIVGLHRFSEPTLEHPTPAFTYRTVYTSFGLEGVRNDTGMTTRQQLLQALLYWVVDRPVVQVSGSTNADVSQPVQFAAHAETNVPASFVQYRWDFGDGSPVVETQAPGVSHHYAQPGIYYVRVEARDNWGHSAVADSLRVEVTGAAVVMDDDDVLPQPQPANPDRGGGFLAPGSDTHTGDLAVLPSASALSHQLESTVTFLTFPETGYTLQGRFLEYWQQHGGLPVFGYPITPQRDGMLTDQVFERTRFEYHSEHTPPYDVLLSHLGVEALEAQGRDWHAFPTVDGAPSDDCLYFAETQHSVCGAFKDYWQRHGLELDGQPGYRFAESLALFGMPLSEAQEEIVVDGSAPLTVQWFERTRFEYHADDSAHNGGRVLLGRLGSMLYTE